MEPAAIEFRLLDAVEAVRDGSVLPLGGKRQRALPALLLLEAGRAVATAVDVLDVDGPLRRLLS